MNIGAGISAFGRWQHWLMALLIVGTFVLGWRMAGFESLAQRFAAYALHKSLGITVLLLLLIRIGWRWRTTLPALPAGMPAWQARAARWLQVALYGLMALVPLSGWLYNSASNFPLRWFGLLNLPPLSPPLPAYKALLADVHGYLAYGLLALATLHALAALKHHFIDRDQVLLRMLKGNVR